jgi:hypothetical protein
MRRAVAIVVVAGTGLAAACESPEATRTRGGGPGADPGNRPAEVRMHEGSRQYWETPLLIPGEPMPLDPAHQARQLSLRGAETGPRPAANSEQRPATGATRDRP